MTAAVDTLEVPGSVQALLAARIDRLAERDKDVLQTAAVIGREFDAPTLAAVVEQDAEQLLAALRSLKDAEFLYEQSLYPVAEYLFKHPLTHEVALNSQLQDRRKRLHAQVAAVLEAAHGDGPDQQADQQAALLAHHWESAGEAWQAAQWHKRAAEWAGITNVAEGMQHWERVRSLVRSLPHEAEALEIGVAACQGTLGLIWRLGVSTNARDVFEEGLRLAEKCDDVGSLAALNGIYACVCGLVDGQTDEYVRYSLEATRLADQTEDQGLQLAERVFPAFSYMCAGRVDVGIELCTASRERFPADPALGREYTGYSPFIALLNVHTWMLMRAGRFVEGAAVCERAEVLARLHRDNEVLTWLQICRVEMAATHGDAAIARDPAHAAQKMGEIAATAQSRQVGLMLLGVAHRLDGEWGESVAMLEGALSTTRRGANRQFEGWVGAELALSLLGLGEQDRAEREAQSAIDTARSFNCRYDEVRANLALTRTQLSRADASALLRAEEALGRAHALIDKTGAKASQPEVHECRARLAQRRGDRKAVEREIEDARRLYTEMGATLQVERLASEVKA